MYRDFILSKASTLFLLVLFLLPLNLDAKSSKYLKYEKLIAALKPIHKELGPTQAGDWLNSHPEKGQTFKQYVAWAPITPTKSRNVIYIQPIGPFNKAQTKIIKETADFMEIFFGLTVKTRKSVPLSVVPKKFRRKNWGEEQLLTTYILYNVLRPRLPQDGVVMLGLTATDLWPGKGWNFVFGQASLKGRVGIWSINRFGNPGAGQKSFKQVLLRTIRTASHETGHMFSIRHCIAYECGMCGSNSLDESDRRPLAFCPECHAKLIWATKQDPIERFKKLIEFCDKNGLEKEKKFYRKSLFELQLAKEKEF